MDKNKFSAREAEGVCRRSVYDEDRLEEMRRERHEMRRRVRNLSCSDGFCGAEDCARCRPGSYRFCREEE